jgi:hypothetical protein
MVWQFSEMAKTFRTYLPEQSLLLPAKRQLPVIEQALEAAALMLGSDKSRGYCLEMICADFLAGVSLETGNQDALLSGLTRLVLGLPVPQREELLESVQVAA